MNFNVGCCAVLPATNTIMSCPFGERSNKCEGTSTKLIPCPAGTVQVISRSSGDLAAKRKRLVWSPTMYQSQGNLLHRLLRLQTLQSLCPILQDLGFPVVRITDHNIPNPHAYPRACFLWSKSGDSGGVITEASTRACL